VSAVAPFILKVLFPSISCEENFLECHINYVIIASLKIFPIPYFSPTTFNVGQTDSLAASFKKKEGKNEGRKANRQKK
jgi:hypothetical protein